MIVKLLHYTPLEVADAAIGKCWGKGCYTGDRKIQRIKRVVLKKNHQSVAEHLVYSFDIDGISRACLQELARHRIASLSVKSTRYTLKELKDATTLSSFLVRTGTKVIDYQNIETLRRLQLVLNYNSVSNDIAKHMLPEAFKTSLIWTVNARSLRNFLSLRSDKAALWEIRELAWKVFEAIPGDHKFLFEDCMKEVKNEAQDLS